MRLIDGNLSPSHTGTMKIVQSMLNFERKQSDIHPIAQIPQRDSMMIMDSPMNISPMSRTVLQRRVRFTLPTSDRMDVTKLCNVFDDVDCMMISDDDSDFTEPSADDVVGPSDMYWGRRDLQKNRLYAQQKAIIIRIKYPKEVEALESVIIECCHSEAMGQQQIHTTKGNFFTIIPTEVTTMHNWSSSYVRGLEGYMTPILSEKRCTIMKYIIRYQSFLQEKQLSPSDISDHLCDYSRELSQPSRDFAMKLAIGDALAASCDP